MSRFVGRVSELAALHEITDAAVEGGVAAAVVIGEPGSGKSRLLAEVAARAELSNRFNIVGYEPERQAPLAAAADMLRLLAGATPAGHGLGQLVFDASWGERSALEPVRVFEAARGALDVVGPALVFVDDLQWVDDLSLALCHYLVRAAETGGQPLSVIAVGRPSENATSLAASIARVLPVERLMRLELGRLTANEALELVRALVPRIDDAAAREFAERSGGSPFWLEALVETAGAEVDAGRLVTARLRGASADSASLLALLAVAGRPLAIADAAALNDWEVGRLEHAERELEARGIAVVSGGTVQLAHDVIRVAAVGEISDEQRRDVHRRVAEWLAETAGSDVRRLREALDHKHEAGLPSLELAHRLVCSPQRTLLGDEGLALLVRIAEEADPSDETVLTLHEQVAMLASELARHDVALGRRLLLAERRQDSRRRSRALLEAARSACALDDSDGARAYLARARAEYLGDELLDLELDTQQAALDLWIDGPKKQTRALAHDAAARGRRLFAVDEQARAAYLEALRVDYEAAYQEDDLKAMLSAADDRAAVAIGFDEQAYLTALTLSARALHLRAGRLDEALERVQYVWGETRRRVLPRLTLDAGYELGLVLLQRGRIAEAREVAAETGDLAARVGDVAHLRHPIERLASEIEFQHGDWRAGIERLLELTHGQSEHSRIEIHQLAALWLALAGGSQLAQEVVAQVSAARTCVDGAGCPRCGTALHLFGAEALVRVGRRAEAAQSLAEWERRRPSRQPRDVFVHRRVRALLGEPVSPHLLEVALREAEELHLTLDALWTRIDLGSALAEADRVHAIDVLGMAAGAAAELGAFTAQQVAEKRLRGLGVRTWRRGPAAEALTERERAIVKLVAAEASNPEIAQQLFLSRKTVERHVSNVFEKVGVRNRAELAARVRELELEGVHR